MIFFSASFNLPVLTNANMKAFVAAPKFNKFLSSCSVMEGSCCTSEIKAENNVNETYVYSCNQYKILVYLRLVLFPLKFLRDRKMSGIRKRESAKRAMIAV